MGFFDFFRSKQTPVTPEQAAVVLPDGKTASPQLAALLPRLEPFALPCIRIKATPANSLTLTDAKFGGYPYWPAGKPYPADSEGRYLYLLAQLNFAQIPKLEGYPDKGLLQFYIGADDLYGMNFDAPTRQEDFRVVYFEDFDAAPIADFSFLDVQELESGMPLKGSMQLAFAPGKDYFSFADFRFSDETAESLIADAEPVKGQHLLEEELTRLYPDEGHKMGGYAYFTQTDPRQDDPAYDDYILLLQVDSQLPDICWGDAGVGNFFIHRADLERRDFSRVLYNWDCT